MKYTPRELEVIALLEKKTGKLIGTTEERTSGFKSLSKNELKRFQRGLEETLYGRLNLDNADCFDGEMDRVKTKVLQENSEIIRDLLGD